MPEIGYVKSSLTRYMTKPTPKLGAFAKEVVRYASGRRDATLTWCTNKASSPLSPGEFETWQIHLELTFSLVEDQQVASTLCAIMLWYIGDLR